MLTLVEPRLTAAGPSRRCRRNPGNGVAGMPSNLLHFTKKARNFVQAVARGSTDGVRICAEQLDERGRSQVVEFPPFRRILEELDREKQWRPKNPSSILSLLYGPLHPELKNLRAATSRAVRDAAKLARELVEATVMQAAPNVQGRHYRTSVAIAELLRKVPGIAGVFLFGSVARGEETANSDVDLLILRAAGIGDALFRHLLVRSLEETAEWVDLPTVRLRPGAVSGPEPPLQLQLLVIDRIPERWSSVGIVESELVPLWRIDDASSLYEARASSAERLITDIGCAVVHEHRWHWHADESQLEFTAFAVLEVYAHGKLELREVEVTTQWFRSHENEIVVDLLAKGKYTTEWPEEVSLLAEDAILQWVTGRTGRNKVACLFRS